MDIIIRTGRNTEITRTITQISFFRGNRYARENATRQALKEFLETVNYKMNFVVTKDGKLFATYDTPGYCDGDEIAPIAQLLKHINPIK